MKTKSIHYSDIEQLIKLHSKKPTIPYVFDPYNKLNYTDGEETLTNEGNRILVNLGRKLIEYKGMSLDSFDLILDFGKAEVNEGFECKSFNYINQPEGYMRWLYQGVNLKSVLAFYNASGKRGQLISRGIKLLSTFRISALMTNGSVKIYSKTTNKLEKSIVNSCDDYSIFMGTPGLQRSILVALIEKNEVKQFLKIPTNEASTKLIQHEKEAILSLHEIESSFFITPALYPTENSDSIRMESLQQYNSIRAADFTVLHAASINEVLSNQAKKTTLKDSEFWAQTTATLEASAFYSNLQLRELGTVGKKIINLISDHTNIWLTWAHGDFTPWNMVINDAKIALYDWELFREEAPALFDLFHFHYQKGILMDHSSVNEIQNKLEETFQNKELQKTIQNKEIDVKLYHRLYLLSTISYFIQVFNQQDINLQNQWQIDCWLVALNKEFYLLKTKGNCRKHFLLDLNDALENIPHAFLKFDFNNLLDLPDSSDLDIAIKEDKIESIAYFCEQSPLVKRLNQRTKSFMSILEIHLNDGSFLSLDLIHDFKRKSITMISADELLRNRKLSKKGVMVPSLRHDLAYAYAFYTLNNSAMPLRYHKHFSNARKETTKEAVTYLNSTFGTSFKSLGNVFTNGKEGKDVLEEKLKSTSFLNNMKSKVNYIKDTITDLIYNRGYLVTFSGVDGAGKSTIIEIVKEHIEQKYRKEVVLLRHRPGILPILSAIKHGKAKAEKIAGDVLPRKGKNKSSLSSILRFGYYYLDYLVGQVYVYFRYIVRGKIVLYDRYYFDFINDSKRSNIHVNKKIAKALYCFVMKPKLNIFLYAEAETILARKQELDAADITEMTKNYKSLFCSLRVQFKNSKYICIENNVLDNTVAAVLKEFELVA